MVAEKGLGIVSRSQIHFFLFMWGREKIDSGDSVSTDLRQYPQENRGEIIFGNQHVLWFHLIESVIMSREIGWMHDGTKSIN